MSAIPPDTIAAIATAPGRGAIGIIRVSGAKVPEIAEGLLRTLPAPRTASLLRFFDAQGAAIDEGVALYFPAPSSFTGEHVLELQGHGGAIVLDLLMQRLVALGCRAALAGEFSERAFVNGKLDLAQAEAVADLIDAGTAAQARAAVRSMRGEFSARVEALQQLLTELRKLVEAAIDFPDEEIDVASDSNLQGRLEDIFAEFGRITAAAREGALLREGLNVVIAGYPNTGKSSLLNRLAGEEIAIVTDLPGTTRDVLRQALQVDGLTVNLVDTAGLRLTGDAAGHHSDDVSAETCGVQTRDAPRGVQSGGVQPGGVPTDELPAGVAVTLVVNKIDLTGMRASIDTRADPVQIHLSAKTGEGLDLLRGHLKQMAGYQGADSGALSARRRHLDALIRARDHVRRGADNFRSARTLELFAEDLRLAQGSLSEITGAFGSEELLGEIFRTF
jgi:tRNA modification GTPase